MPQHGLPGLPLAEHGFALHKGAFHDVLALYAMTGHHPSCQPNVTVHGSCFSVEHALSCAKGGFPSIIRHNKIRDLTATLLTEVYNNVSIEPDVQLATDEVSSGAIYSANLQDSARLDIAANGVTHTHSFSSCCRKHAWTGEEAREWTKSAWGRASHFHPLSDGSHRRSGQ